MSLRGYLEINKLKRNKLKRNKLELNKLELNKLDLKNFIISLNLAFKEELQPFQQEIPRTIYLEQYLFLAVNTK